MFVKAQVGAAGGNFIYEFGESLSSDHDKFFFCCASIYSFFPNEFQNACPAIGDFFNFLSDFQDGGLKKKGAAFGLR